MIDETKDGWFVVNVKDTPWFGTEGLGKVCIFEDPQNRFPQTGIRIYILEPGKPNCRYHREGAQENILVLSGRAKLLVNGEERPLAPWDFVHLPAGVTHVCVGDGDGPCALLMIGHRPDPNPLWYPKLPLAARYGAEAPEETADPKVAYSDLVRWQPADTPEWPLPGGGS